MVVFCSVSEALDSDLETMVHNLFMTKRFTEAFFILVLQTHFLFFVVGYSTTYPLAKILRIYVKLFRKHGNGDISPISI